MPELPAMMARLYTDIFDLAADIRGAPDHQALTEAFGALVSRLGPMPTAWARSIKPTPSSAT
ncbi:hypothetical protein RAA17_11315 [Komagataeibacter rhaeticus]|nr:hypothetical protein [Komagataeibacter rhaeticus]